MLQWLQLQEVRQESKNEQQFSLHANHFSDNGDVEVPS